MAAGYIFTELQHLLEIILHVLFSREKENLLPVPLPVPPCWYCSFLRKKLEFSREKTPIPPYWYWTKKGCAIDLTQPFIDIELRIWWTCHHIHMFTGDGCYSREEEDTSSSHL
jgi:hypothetical protein